MTDNLKSLKSLDIDLTYGGFGKNLVTDFYKPLLSSSVLYKRSTAFFTGGIFTIAASSIKDFVIDNDGKIQLVTSTIFNKDYLPTESKEPNYSELVSAIDNLIEYSNGKAVIELIGTLIANKKLDIKIANVPTPGIHHEKVGIFEDVNGNSLSFSGSINETWSGWTVNSEEFKVFKSWDKSSLYFESDLKQFDDLWNGVKPSVEVFSLPEAVENHLLSYLDDISIEKLEQKIDAVQSWSQKSYLPGIEKKPDEIVQNFSETIKRELMEHQSESLENWKDNDYFGIIKHATGSGKTFTGINGLKIWLKLQNIAIVLVPSVLLLEQWIEEIEYEIEGIDLVKVGGGESKSNWLPILRFLTSKNTDKKTIVVSTIGTALTDDFLNSINWGKHILLLIDEVHNIGSPKSRLLLEYNVGGALGLSATPERYGDEEGTKSIYSFFGKILQPEFSLTDAIEAGRLVPYIHRPFEVTLSFDEEEAYSELSLKISKIYGLIENGNIDKDLQAQLEVLLFARAKIIKKAKNKVPAAVQIIKKDFKEGEHWLLYCQDNDHVTFAREQLKESGIQSLEYMSAMRGDRKSTLDYFEENGGILVAIKCLDEGVDLPFLKNAIILSSSQNPREHIQRRGRVLRKSSGKSLATIYDALVVTSSDMNDQHEQIMSTELRRAYNFSKDAYNPEATIEIKNIAKKYNIDIKDLSDSVNSYIMGEEE
jgi:superfamily II DNA or RNA helicase